MSATSLRIAGVYDSGVAVRLSAEMHTESGLSIFNGKATLSLSTGACNLQTYITPNECEELSSMLLLAAQEMRALLAIEGATETAA